MADPRDDRVSAAYRELPGDGPPAAIDAAIQAAARRAVGSRPGGARRWQIPVSIAAVLALAIGVSLHVEREKPVVVDGTPVPSGSAEYPVPQAEPEKAEPAVREEARAPQAPRQAVPAPEAKRFAAEPPRAERPLPAPAAESVPAPAPGPAAASVATPPAPSVAAPPAAAGAAVPGEAMRAAPQAAKRAKAELSREQSVQEKAMADALETPQRRLERIADLREKGLHDEADRQLAEFRRAYPDYRIPEEWLRRVQRQ